MISMFKQMNLFKIIQDCGCKLMTIVMSYECVSESVKSKKGINNLQKVE